MSSCLVILTFLFVWPSIAKASLHPSIALIFSSVAAILLTVFTNTVEALTMALCIICIICLSTDWACGDIISHISWFVFTVANLHSFHGVGYFHLLTVHRTSLHSFHYGINPWHFQQGFRQFYHLLFTCLNSLWHRSKFTSVILISLTLVRRGFSLILTFMFMSIVILPIIKIIPIICHSRWQIF